MPVNPGIAYQLAEEECRCARTVAEKIRALEKMYATVPKHKGSEGLIREIKTKLSKLRLHVAKERAQKKKVHSVFIKKEGAAQVFLLGVTKSGKSTLLRQFTRAEPEIADYPYTTKEPIVGVLDYHGVKLQLVELPAFFRGYSEKRNGSTYLGMIHNADAVVLVIDCTQPIALQLRLLSEECHHGFIQFGSYKSSDESFVTLPTLIVKMKGNRRVKSPYVSTKMELFPSALWKLLELMYVYTKTPSGDVQYPPVALSRDSSVAVLAERIHKDFLKRLKFARIWGKSAKHPGATVGLEHVLVEGDVVELHVR